MGSHQPRNSAVNIVVTSATRPLLVWIIWRLISASILGRNHSNVRAVKRSFQTNLLSIAISRHTQKMSPSARSLVVRVAKRFTTSHPTTLIFVPRIQLHSPLVNAPPLRKTQTRQLQKNLRGRAKQVPLQNHQPLLNRRLQLQVLAGKRIPFLSLQILSQALTRILLRCTDNTGHKSEPDLAATTDFKIGTIFACPRSVQLPSANNSAASFLIRRLCLKSTSPLVLFCATLKPALSSTTTPLRTTTWYQNSRSCSPIKAI